MKVMTSRERKRVESIVLTLSARLSQGLRLEVHGKAGLAVYLGSTTENRRDCFWYEGPHGRTYKEDPADIVRAILPHVGTLALERAKVLP